MKISAVSASTSKQHLVPFKGQSPCRYDSCPTVAKGEVGFDIFIEPQSLQRKEVMGRWNGSAKCGNLPQETTVCFLFPTDIG